MNGAFSKVTMVELNIDVKHLMQRVASQGNIGFLFKETKREIPLSVICNTKKMK